MKFIHQSQRVWLKFIKDKRNLIRQDVESNQGCAVIKHRVKKEQLCIGRNDCDKKFLYNLTLFLFTPEIYIWQCTVWFSHLYTVPFSLINQRSFRLWNILFRKCSHIYNKEIWPLQLFKHSSSKFPSSAVMNLKQTYFRYVINAFK